MSSTSSEPGAGKKADSAKVQAKAQSSGTCSFCGFVLATYPTLSGMAPLDEATFREHLKRVHGLVQGISR